MVGEAEREQGANDVEPVMCKVSAVLDFFLLV